ncbi:MAG: hypothetical protein J6V72_05010 [Kiritimatiellae bacterium]|nr:hypothetical protein [Kiritimatiellia bacterium]
MASEKHETIADIAAAMRDYSNACNDGYLTEYSVVCTDMRNYADRIEAAHRRESVTERHVLGDAAKLREALEKARLFVGCCDSELAFVNMGCIDRNKLCEEIDAALAAPPRNCDRFNSGNPVKDADDAYAEWQRWCDTADMPLSCKMESGFRQWLFIMSKEGETNGSN